jgi:hypothetical protein
VKGAVDGVGAATKSVQSGDWMERYKKESPPRAPAPKAAPNPKMNPKMNPKSDPKEAAAAPKAEVRPGSPRRALESTALEMHVRQLEFEGAVC